MAVLDNGLLGPAFHLLTIALGGRRADVRSAWERAIRHAVADTFTVAQLLSSISKVIHHVGVTLSEARPGATPDLTELPRDHGTVRFGQRFIVAELLVECELLWRVVFEQVAAALDGGCAAGGLGAFVDAQRRHMELGDRRRV